MAIEDGVQLSTLLADVNSGDDLAQIAESYQARRKERRRSVFQLASKQIELMHLQDGVRQEARDRISLGQEVPNQPNETSMWANKEEQETLYGYEAGSLF